MLYMIRGAIAAGWIRILLYLNLYFKVFEFEFLVYIYYFQIGFGLYLDTAPDSRYFRSCIYVPSRQVFIIVYDLSGPI